MDLCSVSGCGRVSAARGWCKMHWVRWRRHGDPSYESRRANGQGGDKNGYRVRFVDGRNEYEHRLIWIAEHGPIPRGHHIHHRDGNKLNNALDNLECVSHSVHKRRHAAFGDQQTCRSRGCSLPAITLGYCRAHYSRHIYRKNQERWRCNEPGCRTWKKNGGYCRKHARQHGVYPASG